jgi:hypothetical protein
VSLEDFIHRPPGIQAPAILNPTPLRWLRFLADPARLAHRIGRVAGASIIFKQYRLLGRFFDKVV